MSLSQVQQRCLKQRQLNALLQRKKGEEKIVRGKSQTPSAEGEYFMSNTSGYSSDLKQILLISKASSPTVPFSHKDASNHCSPWSWRSYSWKKQDSEELDWECTRRTRGSRASSGGSITLQNTMQAVPSDRNSWSMTWAGCLPTMTLSCMHCTSADPLAAWKTHWKWLTTNFNVMQKMLKQSQTVQGQK